MKLTCQYFYLIYYQIKEPYMIFNRHLGTKIIYVVVEYYVNLPTFQTA